MSKILKLDIPPDLGGGQHPFVSKNVFDILGIRGYMHCIKKRYIDIQLLYYLDELAELFVGHWLPSSSVSVWLAAVAFR